MARFASLFLAIVVVLFFVVVFQTGSSSSNHQKFPDYRFEQSALYQSWLRCVTGKLEKSRGNHTKLWQELHLLTAPCNEPYVSILKIKEYANLDEKKYHISPLVNTSTNTIVTIGIGHDTVAEEKLIEAMGKKNLQFHGTDPTQEINKRLYSKFGKYYPFAVAGRNGYSSADVLGPHGYYLSPVIYVDAPHFLAKLIGLKFFDDIWIDNESGEYEMFPMLIRGGDFDQNGITICQFNVEVHILGDEKQKQFHDFLFQTLDDERYAFFFPVNVGHLRIFFVNFSDEMCRKKYIPKENNKSKLKE